MDRSGESIGHTGISARAHGHVTFVENSHELRLYRQLRFKESSCWSGGITSWRSQLAVKPVFKYHGDEEPQTRVATKVGGWVPLLPHRNQIASRRLDDLSSPGISTRLTGPTATIRLPATTTVWFGISKPRTTSTTVTSWSARVLTTAAEHPDASRQPVARMTIRAKKGWLGWPFNWRHQPFVWFCLQPLWQFAASLHPETARKAFAPV